MYRTIDHDACRVDEHEARAEFGAPSDDAVATDGVQAIQQHLQRSESPAPRPLHASIKHHGHRAVSQKHLDERRSPFVLITPGSLRPKIRQKEAQHQLPIPAAAVDSISTRDWPT